MKEVQEKLLPGEMGVSPRIPLLPPKSGGHRGLTSLNQGSPILEKER
jgi:hypothetical protein